MTSAQFGNYLAGYYAGYSDSEGLLRLVYGAGISYAILGNTFSYIRYFEAYGEAITDVTSVPFISAGYYAGAADRIMGR